ncbi:MAG: RNA methyltransferase [Micrococcales bacterium]|nr:RNA methyltransferase [Micrococcales bacterium]
MPAVDLRPVVDADDPRLVDYVGLTDVTLRTRVEPAGGLYIAESLTVLSRALAAGHRPRSVLCAPRWVDDVTAVLADASVGDSQRDDARRDNVPVYVTDEPLLESITGFHVHRGTLAAMHRPVLAPVADVVAGARRVVVLEDVVDHTNVGAAFRACAGLGVDAVLVTPSCADPLYRRSVRVSMGTVFQVPWTRLSHWPHAPAGEPSDGIDLLRDLGLTVAALALDDDAITLDTLVADPPERLAMVFGTEGDGLRPRTVAACDLTVRIPMSGGVDSLNIASAVAVAAWATRTSTTRM